MKKLKFDLIKVKEILSREQLKHIVGGDGSFGQPCTDDMTCWLVTGGDGYCENGVCTPYVDAGPSSQGCWDRPMDQQCHGSTFGCCATASDRCVMSVGGYWCVA